MPLRTRTRMWTRDEYAKEYEKLQAENERLREVLQKIYNGGGTPKSDFYHIIAKEALKESDELDTSKS